MDADGFPPPAYLRRKAGPSVTLGELLRRLDYATTPDRSPLRPPSRHLLIDLHHSGGKGGRGEEDDVELGLRPKNHQHRFYQPVLPSLVLSFTDLTYSVKNQQRQRGGRLHLFQKQHDQSVDARPDPVFTAPFAAGAAPVGPADLISIEKKKTLLDSVSGEAREGEILAVMGPSGSGKTTLIDALAGRISRVSLGGSVALNGEPLLSGGVGGGLRRRRLLMAAISAYVMQDDLLYPMLTVQETLSFAAQLRLPLPARQRRDRVEALLDQLGLSAAAGTIIGDEGHRGVSGGERRRVSIGIGIVHDPLLLFLDEPTSGLDSTSAFMVVKVLRRIAESGSAVVMSIHQPSSRILGLLDRIMLLSRGRAVYAGTPAGIRPFFAAFGRPVPDGENRAEFALDLIRELESSSSQSSSPFGESGRLVEFNKSWQRKQQQLNGANHGGAGVSLKDAISASISRGKLVAGATAAAGMNAAAVAMPTPSSSTPSAATSKAPKAKIFANPFWVEVLVLMRRSFLNSRRQPKLFATAMGMVLLTAVTLSSLFLHLSNSPTGVRDRLAFLAAALSTVFYTSAEALPAFLHDRYIFIRETAHHAYRRSSFVVALTLSSLPSLVSLSLALAVTTFFPLGLAGGWQGFLFYLLALLAAFWAASSFVTFLAGVIPKGAEVAGFVAVINAIAVFVLMSGFFVTRESIPWYWRWFHYASLVKYPYEAALQGEMLAGGASRCFARGGQVFEGSPLGAAPEAVRDAVIRGMGQTMGFNITSQTCLATGTDILRQLGLTQLGKWESIWIAVGWGFLFRGLFYITLILGNNNKRR